MPLRGGGGLMAPYDATTVAPVGLAGGAGLQDGRFRNLTVTGVATFSSTVTATGQFLAGDGTEGAPAYSFTSDPDTGFRRPGANRLIAITAGADRWEVNASGHLIASDDDTYDIGASGTTRPRTLYLTTSMWLGADVELKRDGAHFLALDAQDAVSTKGFKVYGNPTGGSTEVLGIYWSHLDSSFNLNASYGDQVRWLMLNGAGLELRTAGTARMVVSATAMYPASNNAYALGAGGTAFSVIHVHQIKLGTQGTVGTDADGIVHLKNGAESAYASLVAIRRVVAKTANYAVLSTDARSCFTNEGAAGAVTFTLPGAAAGLEYIFYVQANQSVALTAAAGDTVCVNTTVSAAGGTLTNAGTVGNFVHLVAINATEWVAIAFIGTWS